MFFQLKALAQDVLLLFWHRIFQVLLKEEKGDMGIVPAAFLKACRIRDRLQAAFPFCKPHYTFSEFLLKLQYFPLFSTNTMNR